MDWALAESLDLATSALACLGNRVLLASSQSMAVDRIWRAMSRGSRRRYGVPILIGLTVAAVVAASASALAINVGTTPNVIPDTSGNPAIASPIDGSKLPDGDPGWANEGQTVFFLNAVYIGDGWMLTAHHAGAAGVNFVVPGTTYQPVPSQSFQVPNPMGVPGLSAAYADLLLYRINADPGLPSLTIASQPLGVNDKVVFISKGLTLALPESHWVVDNSVPPNWTSVPSGGTYSGYVIGGGGKRWGTNNIANDNILGDQFVYDPITHPSHSCDPSNPADQCDASDADITTNVGHATIANLTTFDRFSSNPYETQVVNGDSGSPVFHNRGTQSQPQWELAGITLAIYRYPGQDAGYSVYGDASAFADLSSYRNNILSIINTHPDYSIVGDLNLDGVAGGADDIAAFVAGWRYNNGTGAGTMTSWMHGDLNHDGKVDVADFLRMRSGLSPAAGAELTALLGDDLGSGEVPEPASIILAAAPAILLTLCGRRRRVRQTV